jgi:hypothetical protein
MSFHTISSVDIILVGKAVARKAQELLCEQHVAVMQNVKPQLLERIRYNESTMLRVNRVAKPAKMIHRDDISFANTVH